MTKPKFPFSLSKNSNIIRFSCWNIQGYNSSLFGNKFLEHDFLEQLATTDIIGLCETHIHDDVLSELDIANFTRLGYKNCKRAKKANKAPGGIAIFARQNVANMTESYKTKNNDVIWIKIKRQISGYPKDIYIGTAYLSDENGRKNIVEKIGEVGKDIQAIRDKGGEVILQGDFNARIGIETDFVENDKYDPEMSPVSHDIPPRSTMDKVLNARGKELLDMCKTLDLCILNGRKTGDILGNFTSFQPRGNSVIDYGIISQSLFDYVTSFNVGNFMPWLSDHSPIHYSLILRGNRSIKDDPEENEPLPTKWFWDENCNEKFENCLKRDEVCAKLAEIQDLRDADVVIEGINSVLTETADVCQLKKKKRMNKSKNRHNAPWFDIDCQKKKEEISKLSRQIQKNPNMHHLREQLYVLKSNFKSFVATKKKKYKQDIMDQLTCNRKNSRYFWKLLDKLNAKVDENIFKKGISGNRWKTYFQQLFTKTNDIDIPSCSDSNGPLDYDITLEELEIGSYVLRPGKSTGRDGILNEMIRCLLETHPNVILKLFNLILSSGKPVNMWNTSIFTPVHKKGSKMDPDNYRGIALACCLSKFYAAILNRRLLNFAIEKNIIHKSQLGFMPKNRCSDALIILYNLFNKYCRQRSGYMFGCFVDFRKAFDTIPRHLLFQKLLSHNITGKFYESIKNMYANDLASISIGESITKPFRVNQGVKQGCILSPLLFNIFLSDLPDALNCGDTRPVQINNSLTMNSLIWADDLLMLSETENGLNTMLKNLKTYTEKNLIQVNLDKTKCMIFNKTGRLMPRTFHFGEKKLEMVREYRYLGFLVTPSFNITTALAHLKDRGLRAYGALKTKLGITFRKHLPVTFYLFDSLIKPILNYASDFWGALKLPTNNPVETLHRKFCKQLLGVHPQTTNIAVLLETGRLPLEIFAKKNAAKNWDRICLKQEGNELLIASCRETSNDSWSISVKNTFTKAGLLDVFLNEEPSPKTTFGRLFDREKETFIQNSFNSMENMSKLQTFKFLKNNWKIEDYLLTVENISDRTSLSKFRLSDHSLLIEKGRHQNIISSKRTCPFCPGHVENEFHFLIKCPTYTNLRLKLLHDTETLCIGFFYPPDEEFLFWFLMNNPIISDSIAKFVHLSMELRAFLLENHRNRD